VCSGQFDSSSVLLRPTTPQHHHQHKWLLTLYFLKLYLAVVMHMFPQCALKTGAVSNLQRTLSEHGSTGSGLPNPGFHIRQQSVRLALGAPCTSGGCPLPLSFPILWAVAYCFHHHTGCIAQTLWLFILVETIEPTEINLARRPNGYIPTKGQYEIDYLV